MKFPRPTISQEILPQEAFMRMAQEPGAVWLDSSLMVGDRGRYSLIARRPSLDVTVDGDTIRAVQDDGSVRNLGTADGSRALDELWRDSRFFSVGYTGYEASLPEAGVSPGRTGSLPGRRYLFYRSVVRFDHATGAVEVSNPQADDYADVLTGDRVREITTKPEPARLSPALDRDQYLEAVERIRHHIYEGDIYQANFTNRLDVYSNEGPFSVYRRLREVSPSPYGAYLNFGDYQVLSSSPERLFRRSGRYLTCGPIKGTIARGDTAEADRSNRELLLGSEKDRAELLMIVDLMRNDVGRISEIGSVRVPALFRVETYANLMHLVSDVTGQLRPDVETGDILRALMPGGSITGAPKKRAVEIINSLEKTPREIYTGSIGWLRGEHADFNIAIRTMTHRDGCYHVHAGGGIVADSSPEAEYEEMRLKAKGMLAALGVRWQ